MKMTEVPVTRAYSRSQKVPTKIIGIYGHLDLLLTAIKVALGWYNPV